MAKRKKGHYNHQRMPLAPLVLLALLLDGFHTAADEYTRAFETAHSAALTRLFRDPDAADRRRAQTVMLDRGDKTICATIDEAHRAVRLELRDPAGTL
ncbi:MAG TPA: hypothetical protein VG106_13720, partial [Vicinamibacterales bacterium]|nr:hypothetical protein [Vicinamibacterales bacterium]